MEKTITISEERLNELIQNNEQMQADIKEAVGVIESLSVMLDLKSLEGKNIFLMVPKILKKLQNNPVQVDALFSKLEAFKDKYKTV